MMILIRIKKYQTIKILSKFGITDLAFGIEDGKSEALYSIFNIINSDKFEDLIKNNINNEISYKNAFSQAFKDMSNDNDLLDYLEKPNFTLALQYLKAVQKYNRNINIHPIPRIDNYYNNELCCTIEDLKKLIKKMCYENARELNKA